MDNQLISFKAEDKEFPMEITDKDGERWIPSQQVGEALGTKNIRDLVLISERPGNFRKANISVG
jgi:hypothetical protein